VLTLTFQDGTLLVESLPEDGGPLAGLVVWDGRVRLHRAAALAYAAIIRRLHGRHEYRDQARAYREIELVEADPRPLRHYQRAALEAWESAQRRGVVVLPTGAGKSYVALRAMLACRRSALVLAPTIDLVVQWAADLEARLGRPVGQYGGGEKRLEDVTVATYDSGVLMMPWHGNRFGLVVFDECHHLPSGVTRQAAAMSIAPWRLGLTATPERADGLDSRLDELVGPIVHRTRIDELEGSFLASYQAEVLEVAMDADEAAAYAAHRAQYLAFLRASGVQLSGPDGWQRFLAAAGRDPRGRAALRAWREQKRLARASRAKLRATWELLREHAGERIILFTDDNDTAYEIGRRFILPVLTHHTRPAERKAMLARFRDGTWPVLVTSKVLNEGVDVPEASVGIIVSGSGSVREHVQRLGRILRPRDGKVAVLYELVSAGTAEGFTSERRRSHAAFGELDWRD
jgi:superfamily II DNA or RNA helicase